MKISHFEVYHLGLHLLKGTLSVEVNIAVKMTIISGSNIAILLLLWTTIAILLSETFMPYLF